MLQSVNLAIFGDAVAGTGTDPTTIINSILGAYGLPKLKATAGYCLRDEFEEDFVFEYPRSWVARRNSQREGVVVSNFDTPDKAAVEVFPDPEDGADLVREVVRRAVAPGQAVGGDARLELPAASKVKTQSEQRGDVEYTLITFPSETVTRSGYQIPRRNWAVAAERHGRVYALIASGQRDRLGPEQEAALRHIVQTFRVR